jgi:ketosteroid isomerase-like protein
MTSTDDAAARAAATALAAIEAVEARDLEALAQLYDPDVEFEWPPGLPYSGVHRGADVVSMTANFRAVWQPLQPTADEARMDPVVIAATADTVVIEYTWRAVDQSGNRFQTSTLAHYEVRGGRLARARMYYADHAGLLEFLVSAGVQLAAPRDIPRDAAPVPPD